MRKEDKGEKWTFRMDEKKKGDRVEINQEKKEEEEGEKKVKKERKEREKRDGGYLCTQITSTFKKLLRWNLKRANKLRVMDVEFVNEGDEPSRFISLLIRRRKNDESEREKVTRGGRRIRKRILRNR